MGGSKYPRSKVDLGGGRGWLTKEAAASIFRIDRAIGHRLQITEAGRSFFQQDQHWQKYRRDGWPIAINPRNDPPSVHQIGDAIDSDEAQRFVALMAEHGWIRTVYRWVGGVWTLVERWHFEYFPSRDKRRLDPVPAAGGKSAPATPEEEFMDMLYFYCEELDTAYVVHPWTGKKRALPSAEYEAALEAGKKFKRGVSKAKANKIPNA
ncbi:hypothetical protein AB0O70_05335 [Microbacterium paraoxydans]|uniref:hypothetical protein n=1 Tax=Microbacterium paraoxydans TaxID=199592 RepID=UPI00342E2E19